MDNDRFLSKVRLFNTLVFACIGIVLLAGLIYLAYRVFEPKERLAGRLNATAEKAAPERMDNFTWGTPQPIAGTNSLRLALRGGRDRSFSSSYDSGGHGDAVNYLFFDSNTGGKRWLFPGTGQWIASAALIPTDTLGKSEVRAILYDVVRADTDNDQKLTVKDAHAIALSTARGERYTELIAGVQELLGFHAVDANRVFLIFRKDNRSFTAMIDMRDFKLAAVEPIPALR